MRSILRTLCNTLPALVCIGLSTAQADDNRYLRLAESLCKDPAVKPQEFAQFQTTKEDIVVRGSKIGTRYRFSSEQVLIEFEYIAPTGRPPVSAFTASNTENNNSKPELRLVLSGGCELTQAQRIAYDGHTALYVETLDDSLTPLPEKNWLNPPVPKSNRQPAGLRVALIDSGVNYTLPKIADTLARDEKGNLIGYDFWDNDNTPYDANPARSPFFVQRHGTRTASILIAEAPGIALVPYRYPRPDMSRMTELVAHAARHSVRIIGMPLGSNNYKEWLAFGNAAKTHPQILFIVSAGNNGRDIDINPVYPAALEHPNILVVTSSDDYIRPAERTNYGKISVDYLIPAENISTTDYNGSAINVSGSSYAVSRLTALAARLLNANPGLTTEDLKEKIQRYSIKANTGKYVYLGYIGDPLADTTKLKVLAEEAFTAEPVKANAKGSVPVNIVVLDPNWTRDRIKEALAKANAIFSQCDFQLTTNSVLRVQNPQHLAYQTPGHALTLHRELNTRLKPDITSVYLTTDTAMQEKFDAEAFGLANTGSRPWMKNSVWITVATRDSGHALAHELYHVLANRGDHNNLAKNLMRDQTATENTELTPEQCQLAIDTAAANGLLQP